MTNESEIEVLQQNECIKFKYLDICMYCYIYIYIGYVKFLLGIKQMRYLESSENIGICKATWLVMNVPNSALVTGARSAILLNTFM